MTWDTNQLAQWGEQALQMPTSRWQAWRAQQWEKITDAGFPDRKDEAWKYTDIAPLIKQSFQYAEPSSTSSAIESSEEIDIQSIAELSSELSQKELYTVIFINGHFQPSLSNIDELPDGVILMNLSQGLIDYADKLPLLIHDKQTAFSALNANLMGDGLLLWVPDHVEVVKPIHMVYLTTEDAAMHMQHPRHFIIAGEGSRLSVFEEYVGLGEHCYFNNIVTHIQAQPAAQVFHYKLQRESQAAYHLAHIELEQYAHSQVHSHCFSVGGALARDDIHCDFIESGAECELNGLYYLQDQQHFDIHSCIDHRVPHCSSWQTYKGILDDTSTGVFNGKVVVHPNAKGSSAEQVNNNLLLGDKAVINTKPELEIDNDDVKCSHGATVGQMDAKALFYLRSRGIEHEQAQEILTYAFAENIIAGVQDESIAAHIRSQVMKDFTLPMLEEVSIHG